MKKLFSLIITLSLAITSYAQSPINFGSVNLAELKNPNAYPQGAILYKHGYTYFVNGDKVGMKMVTEYHVKARITNEDSKKLGKIHIDYRMADQTKTYETVDNIKGKTYWIQNGLLASSELNSKNIVDKKISGENYSIDFELPDISNDCIVEYTYSISTPLSLYIQPFRYYFQEDVPVVHAQYQLRIPEFFNYNLIHTGYLPYTDKKETEETIDVGLPHLTGNGKMYNFIMTQLPAFVEEPFLSAKENYISKITVDLINSTFARLGLRDFTSSWRIVNSNLNNSEHFGKVIFKKYTFLEEYLQPYKKITDKREQLEALYAQFVKDFKADGFSKNIQMPNDQKNVFDQKKGTHNQINALFISMAKQLNLDVTPVVISTRDNGFIQTEFPRESDFNYILAKINFKEAPILIDATHPNYPMGTLPVYALNQNGFEVKGSKGEVIPIVSKTKHWQSISYQTQVSPDAISGNARENHLGYSRLEVENKFKSKNQVKNENDPSQTLTVQYDFTSSDFNKSGDEIRFTPFLDKKWERNPLAAEERLYPVDFGYTQDFSFENSIEIPKDYSLVAYPKSLSIATPDKSATFIFQAVPKDNIITIVARYSIKKAVYTPAEYPDLKLLYETITQKTQEEIVLKRK